MSSTTYRFYYDPMHRLIYSQQPGLRFGYDGDRLATEYDNSGTYVLRRYVFGPNVDEPLVWYEGSGTSDKRWLAADAQGSVVQVTNAGGTALSVNTYDEYGLPSSPGDPNAGRFRYTGQQWVPELGMYYYKARIYAPTLGRFMQWDPIGYGDQINLYTYVANDPVNGTDPSGQDSFWVARPLDSKILAAMHLGHGFIVVDAKYPGDPHGRVISFGALANGNMGNVNDPSRAADMSKTAHATDIREWKSLNSQDTAASASRIDAPDKVVAAVAGAISENNPYSAVPRATSPIGDAVNSNSAAKAVADTSTQMSGGQTTPKPGSLGLPGINESSRVTIDVGKVCSTPGLNCH